MITNILTTAAVATSLLIATPSFAGELKGAAAAQAINGKNFSCKAGSLKFTLKFAKADPKGAEFPFVFKSKKDKVENAYIIKKNGKLIRKTGRQSRRVYAMDGGGISIKASGRPTAKCVPM